MTFEKINLTIFLKTGHHVPFYIFIFRLRSSFYKMSQNISALLEISRDNLEIARNNLEKQKLASWTARDQRLLEVSRNNLEAQKLANRTARDQRLEKIEAGNAAIKVALNNYGIILIFYFI